VFWLFISGTSSIGYSSLSKTIIFGMPGLGQSGAVKGSGSDEEALTDLLLYPLSKFEFKTGSAAPLLQLFIS
jgi:hypothetical protein